MTAPETPTPTTEAQPEGKTEEVDVRNLQAKFNGLLDQRNAFNDMAKAAREERDMLNEQRRVKSAEIEEHKKQRDAANDQMRIHKELRNAYQEQAKALIDQKKGKTGAVERSLPLRVRKLRNDLQAAVEQQQTTSLTVAKEKVLVEKIRAMWLELKELEVEVQKQKAVQVELSGADKDIDELFARADTEHAEVTKWMKTAREHHEKFIASKTKADDLHGKAMELREKVMQVRGERKAEYDARRKEMQEINQTARRNVADPRAIDQYKDQALEQLKKGGKITLGF